MRTRSANKYLLEKFKEAGLTRIEPGSAFRLVSSHLDALPERWQNQDRDGVLKLVREACEQLAALGFVKRKRVKEVAGYVYEIKY